MSRRVAFWLALLPQVLLLGFLIAREEARLRSAPRVLLRVVVSTLEEDPWYGMPRLEVARVATGAAIDSSGALPTTGTRIYVTLAADEGGIHRAAGWSRRHPSSDVPFVAGRVMALDDEWIWLDCDVESIPYGVTDGVATVRLSPSGEGTIEGFDASGR